MKKIKLGISACLVMDNVRYDGNSKLDHYLTDTFGQFVEWVPVCPEVGAGLPVPREAMQLVGDPNSPRIVTIGTGVDRTDMLTQWTTRKLKSLEKDSLCGFIFKSRSPSCGIHDNVIYTAAGTPVKESAGIFAKAFMEHFPDIPVEDNDRLHDPAICAAFVRKIKTANNG